LLGQVCVVFAGSIGGARGGGDYRRGERMTEGRPDNRATIRMAFALLLALLFSDVSRPGTSPETSIAASESTLALSVPWLVRWGRC
jgi:hypothetical protein